MRIIIILILTFISSFLYAQDSIPVYKRFPSIPPFSILKFPDSTKFVKDDLENKKATIIFLFSPDCDHCKEATRNLLANMEEYKKIQVILVTPLEFKYIRPFAEEFQLTKYSNIIVGSDRSWFLGTYYGIKNFPSIYLYDKKGRLVDEASGHVDFKALVKKL